MRAHLRLAIFALALTLAFWLGIMAWGTQPSYAQSQCPNHYTVKPGDWLMEIARRYGLSYSDLLRANPQIWNPSYLLPGQVICLPTPPGRSKVVLESLYRYNPETVTITLQTRAGLLGRRVALTLSPIDGVDFYTSTTELGATLQEKPVPILIAMRVDSQSTQYRLLEVGSTRLLASLNISPTESLNLPLNGMGTPIDQVLGVGKAAQVGLQLLLETEDGLRYPLTVSQVGAIAADKLSDVANSGDLAFIVFPTRSGTPGEYRLNARVENDVLGPRGVRPRLRCGIWSSGGSWWYSFLSSFYHCSYYYY